MGVDERHDVAQDRRAPLQDRCNGNHQADMSEAGVRMRCRDATLGLNPRGECSGVARPHFGIVLAGQQQ